MNFLITTTGYNPVCGGVRVMGYLAAMIHAAGYPVWTDEPCFFNPLIPISKTPGENTVTVYPDGVRGNPFNAERVCRYFLYFASGYFGGDRVPKRECAIVYHEDYFDDVAEHCDNTLTIKDIITMPYFDAMWCFPEKKTIRSVFFQGKGRAAPELDAIPIPAPQGCLHVSRQRTLATLRAAENFYTTDLHTLMAYEAILCGCRVWIPDGDGFKLATFNPFDFSPLMNPKKDIETARLFAERVTAFFAPKI